MAILKVVLKLLFDLIRINKKLLSEIEGQW